MALAYVARFATTRGKLLAYLQRKIRERGVSEEEGTIDIEAVADRLVELRYVDDEVFARARSQSLLGKGYGARRVAQALHAAGIDSELREEMAPGEAAARQSALAFARRRRLGPFGARAESHAMDRSLREKQIAAMIRAGHDYGAACALIDSASIEDAEEWAHEAEEDFDDS